MGVASRFAFADFFSFYLNCVEMNWPFWANWEPYLQKPKSNCSRQFLLRVVNNCVPLNCQLENAGLPLTFLGAAEKEKEEEEEEDGGQDEEKEFLDGVVATAVEKIRNRDGWESVSEWLNEPKDGEPSSDGWRSACIVRAVLSADTGSIHATLNLVRTFAPVLISTMASNGEVSERSAGGGIVEDKKYEPLLKPTHSIRFRTFFVRCS